MSSHGTSPQPWEMARIPEPSISSIAMSIAEEGESWINEIIPFKETGTLPKDKAAVRRIRRTGSWYCIINGRLYRRGFSRPLLRCLHPTEARTTIAEIHEGICGDHISARTLVGDLVLRKAEVNDPTRSRGKLAPNWEGPYQIADVIREGTCTLATVGGRLLSRT
ncbi:hypothetical protein GW17_00010913 [Ensete ventricosum]|nr:hypothetical protein GW17_00010913 [Ensete ventricosum]